MTRGRKTNPDKKIQFPFYIRPSIIDALGKDRIKKIIEKAINDEMIML